MHWDMETVVMDLRSTLSQTGSNPGSETPPRPVHPAHSVAGDSCAGYRSGIQHVTDKYTVFYPSSVSM